MNKRIDFTQPGGFPLTQDTLDFMQNGFNDTFQGIGSLMENGVISGAVVTGGSISSGWVVYQNEILPFVGGAYQSTCLVKETNTPLVFEDGNSKNVLKTRWIECGVGVGQFATTILTDVRFDLADMKSRITNLKSLLSDLTDYINNDLAPLVDTLQNNLTDHILVGTHDYSKITDNPMVKRSTSVLSNCFPGATSHVIALGTTLSSANYDVLGSIYGSTSVNIRFEITAKTTTNFTVSVYNSSGFGGATYSPNFDYIVVLR